MRSVWKNVLTTYNNSIPSIPNYLETLSNFLYFLNWSLHSDIKWPALCWSELGYPVFFWPKSWKLAIYVTSCVALYLLPKPFRQNTIVKEKKNQCKMSEWLHTLCHLLFQLKLTNSTSKLMISIRYYVQTIKDLVSKR